MVSTIADPIPNASPAFLLLSIVNSIATALILEGAKAPDMLITKPLKKDIIRLSILLYHKTSCQEEFVSGRHRGRGILYSDCPINNLIGPFFSIRGIYSDIVIRIAFHYPIFCMGFKKNLAGLAYMLIRKKLHFHVTEIPKNFISFMTNIHGYNGLYI